MNDAIVTTGPTDVLAPTRAALPPDRHPVLVYLARLVSPASRATMRRALDVAADVLSHGRADALGLPWWSLGYQHAAALRAALVARYRPATCAKVLSAVRGVLEEAEGLRLMSPDDARAAVRPLRRVKGETLPRGRALARGELTALFSTCADAGPAGARDAALLALAYGCGLRRSEVVALDLADVNATTGAVTVRGGKGRKDRVAYAPPGAADALVAWSAVRGAEPGAYLTPVLKSDRVVIRRLTAQAVYVTLKARAAAAHVADFSPHDLRRSFVSDLLDAGADLVAVQKLAGHARPETTARYDRRGEVAKQRAAGLLCVPYAGGAR